MRLHYSFFIALLLSVVSCNNTTPIDKQAVILAKEKMIETKIETFINSYLNKKNETVLNTILIEDYVRRVNGITVASNSEELKASMNIFFIGFSDLQIINERSYIKDNEVFVHFTFTGTNTGVFAEAPATGKKVKVSGLSHFYFNEEGKMYQEDVFYNELGFLQQLGHSLIPPVTE